jgi:hypothetical protein
VVGFPSLALEIEGEESGGYGVAQLVQSIAVGSAVVRENLAARACEVQRMLFAFAASLALRVSIEW